MWINTQLAIQIMSITLHACIITDLEVARRISVN